MQTAKLPPIKLVVNANARNLRALRQLLFSLLSVGHYLWEDTVVVLGGDGMNLPPTRRRVSEFAGVPSDAPISLSNVHATLVVVHMAEHSFDYHGYNALWQYQDDPLIAAQGYLYTVDTTLAHPGFPRRLHELGKLFRQTESKRCSLQVITVKLPNANLAAFGIGVLLQYRTNFLVPNMTKHEAVDIEKACEGSRAKALVEFAGSVVEQHPRKSCGHHDVYVTRRSPRLCWYYDGLHLLKFQDPHTTSSTTSTSTVSSSAHT